MSFDDVKREAGAWVENATRILGCSRRTMIAVLDGALVVQRADKGRG
jgi:hypothetical protein